ncbi:inlI [Symbiodinium necroappetens]|uniref:InlI protein n=1 Tax=Symbiodinium necroappetens TaxID=1628268 RepID=A0A812P2C6_9DINO|nr:inlI [Symbiodinium necroappetens]
MLGCSGESTLEVDGQEKVRTFMTTHFAVPLDFQECLRFAPSERPVGKDVLSRLKRFPKQVRVKTLRMLAGFLGYLGGAALLQLVLTKKAARRLGSQMQGKARHRSSHTVQPGVCTPTAMESDHGDASSDDDIPAKHFRFTDALTEVPNGDAEAAAALLLGNRQLTSVDSLESFKNLKKAELQGNSLSSLGFLEMNHSLCWLGVAKNKLRKISGLTNLSSLAVLDISDNKVTRLAGLEGLQSLKALIAARNRIAILGGGLSPKRNPLLETLILSYNHIEQCALTGFKNLKKVSLAHNRLHSFPSLKKLPALSELRLNGNKLLAISPVVASLPHLATLDVGNNLIKQISGFEALQGLLWLTNLNVRGNVSEGDDVPDQLQKILASLPRLEILNGKRQSGKTKKKRKHNQIAPSPPRWSDGPVKAPRGGRGFASARGAGRGRGSARMPDSDAEEPEPLRRGRGGKAGITGSSNGPRQKKKLRPKAVEAQAEKPSRQRDRDPSAPMPARVKDRSARKKVKVRKTDPDIVKKGKKSVRKKRRARPTAAS